MKSISWILTFLIIITGVVIFILFQVIDINQKFKNPILIKKEVQSEATTTYYIRSKCYLRDFLNSERECFY